MVTQLVMQRRRYSIDNDSADEVVKSYPNNEGKKRRKTRYKDIKGSVWRDFTGVKISINCLDPSLRVSSWIIYNFRSPSILQLAKITLWYIIYIHTLKIGNLLLNLFHYSNGSWRVAIVLIAVAALHVALILSDMISTSETELCPLLTYKNRFGYCSGCCMSLLINS